MIRKMIAVVVAAMAAMLLAGTFDTADARKGGWRGGSHGGFHRNFRSGRFHGLRAHRFRGRSFHRRHRFRRRHFFVGVPYFYDYGDYAYRGRCHWLRRRAIRTGRRYWWRRYRDCLYDYGYGYGYYYYPF